MEEFMKKALMLATVASMIEQFNMGNIELLQNLGYKVDIAAKFYRWRNTRRKSLRGI